MAWDEDQLGADAPAGKPRTLVVVAILAGVALVLSWLWAYALTAALISAEFLGPWPAGRDPRMLWMVESFLVLLAGSIVGWGLVRWMAARQMRRIDEMAEGEMVGEEAELLD